jgi:hypothetical protein
VKGIYKEVLLGEFEILCPVTWIEEDKKYVGSDEEEFKAYTQEYIPSIVN